MPINYDPEAWKRSFQNYLAAKQLTTGTPVRPEEMGSLALAELQNRSTIDEKNFEMGLKSQAMAFDRADKLARNALEQDKIDAFKPNPAQTYVNAGGGAMKIAQGAMALDKGGYLDFLKPISGAEKNAVQNWNGTEMGVGQGSGQPTGSYTPYTPVDTPSATPSITTPDVWGNTPNATSFGENVAYGQDIMTLPGEEALAATAEATNLAAPAVEALSTAAPAASAAFDAASNGIAFAAPAATASMSWVPFIGWSMAIRSLLGFAENAIGVNTDASVAGDAMNALTFSKNLGENPGDEIFTAGAMANTGNPIGALPYYHKFFGEGTSAEPPSIVCTELNRQGYLPWNVMVKDSEYRKQYVPFDAYYGYLMLFSPVVRAMQKSRLVTTLIRPFGVATAREMASRVDNTIKGSWLGKVILKIGIPLCRFYCRFRHPIISNIAEVM